MWSRLAQLDDPLIWFSRALMFLFFSGLKPENLLKIIMHFFLCSVWCIKALCLWNFWKQTKPLYCFKGRFKIWKTACFPQSNAPFHLKAMRQLCRNYISEGYFKITLENVSKKACILKTFRVSWAYKRKWNLSSIDWYKGTDIILRSLTLLQYKYVI